jgi:hypothetical protein
VAVNRLIFVLVERALLLATRTHDLFTLDFTSTSSGDTLFNKRTLNMVETMSTSTSMTGNPAGPVDPSNTATASKIATVQCQVMDRRQTSGRIIQQETQTQVCTRPTIETFRNGTRDVIVFTSSPCCFQPVFFLLLHPRGRSAGVAVSIILSVSSLFLCLAARLWFSSSCDFLDSQALFLLFIRIKLENPKPPSPCRPVVALAQFLSSSSRPLSYVERPQRS